MKNKWAGVSLPPNTPLPQNEFFHTDSFAGGYDARDAQEDIAPGSTSSMLDMEITRDDRLIRAPGVPIVETLPYTPTQVLLHAGFKYRSEMLMIAAPHIGVKSNGDTIWFNAALRTDINYAFGNFAGVLLMSGGIGGLWSRQPGVNAIERIPGAPAAFGITVFANRVVLGGTIVGGNLDFMGIGWSDATSDYKGWDYTNGAGSESMIGSQRTADRFQGFSPVGYDTLGIINRRSIWIATPTGDTFEPMRIVPRIEGTGCVSVATIVPTEFGVIFLSDDGVRIFNGNEAPVISEQINAHLVIREDQTYSASFDPTLKRYYLHTPLNTWVYDLLKNRWYKWKLIASGSVFFPAQGARGITWGQATGTWGSQTKAWWQFLPTEKGGSMYFTKTHKLGREDASSFNVFDGILDPQWYDRISVGQNLDALHTGLGARFTYESTTDATIQVWLPDKPDGNFERVTTDVLRAGAATKRRWIPFIHTGRGISLGIKIVSGSPRIRKASVEYQTTGMLFEAPDLDETTPPDNPIVIDSDALVAPEIVYSNGYEIQGQIYRQPRNRYTSTLRGSGGNGTIVGDFLYNITGGRQNGGYVTSLTSEGQLDADNKTVGQYILIPLAFGQTPPTAVEFFHAFNLFSQPLVEPLGIMGFATDQGSAPLLPSPLIQIMPDYTVRAMRLVGGLPVVYEAIGAVSTVSVPSTGWFAFDVQPFASRFGGFLLVNLHTADTPPEGIPLFRFLKVDTGTAEIHGYAVGTQLVPGHWEMETAIPHGIEGIGFDDCIVARPGGSVRRFFYDTFVGAGIPSGPGDSINSSLSWNSTFVYNHGSNTETLGVVAGPHGSEDRWRNVTGLEFRPLDETTWRLAVVVGEGSSANVSLSYGNVSVFTGDWLHGPFDPPHYGQQNSADNPDPAIGPPFDLAEENGMTRNTMHDDQLELHATTVNRDMSTVAAIEGIFPYARAGARWLIAVVEGGDIFGDASTALSFVSQHSVGGGGAGRRDYRIVTKSGGVTVKSTVASADANGPQLDPLGSSGLWSNRWNYELIPNKRFIDRDPGTGNPFDPASMSVQVGTQGDFTTFDTQVDPPADRWLHHDVIEVGYDLVYHIDAITVVEADPSIPIAHGVVYDTETDLDAGHVVVYADSIDWDGTVVSNSINWGDGSPTEDIGITGFAGRLSHDYAAPGVYTITITATDDDGLTDTFTLEVDIPIPTPTADFGYDADFDEDPSGQTIIFTDGSTTPTVPFGTNSIVSWDWDFGDGTPHSTLQNPTHTYAEAGDYSVVLAVENDLGGADSSPIVVVTVPIIAPATGCPLTDEALANTPFVQSDDLNGGNPPLPAPVSLAGFDNYYYGSTFRESYDNPYDNIADGISHSLDLVNTFNGHPTLKMVFGSLPAPSGHARYIGAGWDTIPTNDGSPEVYYSNSPHFGPLQVWKRIRWRAEAGVMSDGSATSSFSGLDIIDFLLGNGSVGIYNRSGRIFLDMRSREVTGDPNTNVSTDLGPDSDFFVGRGDDLFGELIVRYIGDPAGNTIRATVWMGDACSLEGATNVADISKPAFKNTLGTPALGVQTLSNFNWIFTPTGANKALWWADWETEPITAVANPYNVSLP